MKAKAKKKVAKKESKLKHISAVTIRHRKVVKEMAENGRKIGEALKIQGYSESVQKSPTKVTNSRSFKKMMEEEFSDDLLAVYQKKELGAHKIEYADFPMKMDPEEAMLIVREAGFNPYATKTFMGQLHVFYFRPDFIALDKALDKLYKMKGRYKETLKIEDDKWRKMSDTELAEIIAKGKRFFKKQ